MRVRRRVTVAVATVTFAALVGAIVPTSVGATLTFPGPNWIDTFGSVALSSPTVATIDGVTAVVFGSENGYVNVVDAATGLNLPGWPQPVSLFPGAVSPVESSPPAGGGSYSTRWARPTTPKSKHARRTGPPHPDKHSG